MMLKQLECGFAIQLLACSLIAHLYLSQSTAQAQDILRQQPHSQPQGSLAAQLANIQLPPQLASLTPQQLHHLAQLRELQLQQQKQQQNQASSANLSPGSQEQQAPTVQPTTVANDAQIPQPNSAAADTSANGDTNDRHDDGSYNEAGTEMEGIIPASESASSNSAPRSNAESAAGGAPQQQAPTFEVNWNKCPQLEPTETEKNRKTLVITKCLQSAPIPTNLTRENVEAHREQIATCALKVEGWFSDSGDYKYDKAELEIRSKKLDPQIELQVLKFHVACKDEASKKFPRDQNKLIDQVQFYQACMDFYVAHTCMIEVTVD